MIWVNHLQLTYFDRNETSTSKSLFCFESLNKKSLASLHKLFNKPNYFVYAMEMRLKFVFFQTKWKWRFVYQTNKSPLTNHNRGATNVFGFVNETKLLHFCRFFTHTQFILHGLISLIWEVLKSFPKLEMDVRVWISFSDKQIVVTKYRQTVHSTTTFIIFFNQLYHLFLNYAEICIFSVKLQRSVLFSSHLHWKLLNVFVDNVIIQLMWSIRLRLTQSQVTIDWVLCISRRLLIVIIWLMLSVSVCPNVITLSSFHWSF
jgi:hypothetical protein